MTTACLFLGPSSIILALTWTLFSTFDSLLTLLTSLLLVVLLWEEMIVFSSPHWSHFGVHYDSCYGHHLSQTYIGLQGDKKKEETLSSNLSEDIRDMFRNSESSPGGPESREVEVPGEEQEGPRQDAQRGGRDERVDQAKLQAHWLLALVLRLFTFPSFAWASNSFASLYIWKIQFLLATCRMEEAAGFESKPMLRLCE